MTDIPDTRTICELDASGFWTGQARDVGPMDGRPPTWVEAPRPPGDGYDPAKRGWAWLGAWALSDLPAPPAPLPPAVPEIISDRQCFQQLAVLGKVTQDEALAAVTVGALPKVITDGIASLPADQQFPAKMMLCGATSFQRSHPITPVLGAFLGLDGPDLYALWRAAALL